MGRWFATVRVRTTVFATLVVTAALVVGALVLLFVQQRTLVTDVEQSASSRAADVAGLAKRRALPADLTAAKEEDAFTQVVDEHGRVIAASENLRELGVTHAVLPPSTRTVQTSVRLPPLDGRFRVVIRPTDTANGRVTVYAGDSLETVSDATQQMALLLGIGLPLLVGLVAVTTWWVTGRAMRPVEAIRSEVSAIGERGLHRRVPEPPTDDEVGRLARTMNAMLARLDDSAERQRRFVSDASHELQSPLTSLRARLEVDLAARNEPDWRAGDREALVEVKEMQRLVDDLLTLARLDAPVASFARVPVDLDDLVLQEAERLRTRGRVTVDAHGVSAGQVLGDPDQLRRALRNVLDNAERHAASDVAVSVREHDARIDVVIVDDGAGIAAEHRKQIFERFGRIDDARTRDGASTGLGLAITREIVEAHGGTITVDAGVPGGAGARFVLCFPTADATA
jgi:signal transduction histidine kinase